MTAPGQPAFAPRFAQPPRLVAIVGGSGSGKTWLADQLQDLFAPCATRLSLDNFYRDQSHVSLAQRTRINFDQPRAIDWPSFERALRQLLAGRPAQIPDYDFATHSRRTIPKVLRPEPLIFVEGLWLLRRPSLRRLFCLSIFLDCPARTRRARRIARDVQSRGRTPDSVHQQFRETVQPMHLRYVAPQSRWADIVLRKTCTASDVRKITARLIQRHRGKRLTSV